MRLFIGIEPAGEAKDAILGVWERLSQAISRQGVRFVRPEKLHVTLAFLGDIAESDLPELKTALERAGSTPPISLTTGLVGCFPDMRRPKVVWMGLGGEVARLRDLAARVADAAKPYAPGFDEKPFAAHLTLARISPPSKEIGRMLAHLDLDFPAAEFPVDCFALINSKPDGTYEVLQRVPLTPDA